MEKWEKSTEIMAPEKIMSWKMQDSRMLIETEETVMIFKKVSSQKTKKEEQA